MRVRGRRRPLGRRPCEQCGDSFLAYNTQHRFCRQCRRTRRHCQNLAVKHRQEAAARPLVRPRADARCHRCGERLQFTTTRDGATVQACGCGEQGLPIRGRRRYPQHEQLLELLGNDLSSVA
jgi:hypothetical protein